MTQLSSTPADTPSVHTIVCDLDDTLFAESDYVRSGFRAVDRWLISNLGITGFAGVAWELFAQGVRGKTFDLALSRFRMSAPPDLVSTLVAVYRDHLPDIALLTDAAVFLDQVSGRYRLALVTDGYLAVQQKKVKALDIASRFEIIVFTDALGRAGWKPHPAGFLRVMERLPGKESGYLYVGDNPRKDFIAPRSLGWKTVRVRRGNGEHSTYEPTAAEAADREITTLRDLPHLIDAWCKRCIVDE